MSIDSIVATLVQIRQTVSNFFKTGLWKGIEVYVALAFGVVAVVGFWITIFAGAKERAKKAEEKKKPPQGES